MGSSERAKSTRRANVSHPHSVRIHVRGRPRKCAQIGEKSDRPADYATAISEIPKGAKFARPMNPQFPICQTWRIKRRLPKYIGDIRRSPYVPRCPIRRIGPEDTCCAMGLRFSGRYKAPIPYFIRICRMCRLGKSDADLFLASFLWRTAPRSRVQSASAVAMFARSFRGGGLSQFAHQKDNAHSGATLVDDRPSPVAKCARWGKYGRWAHMGIPRIRPL